MSSIVKRGKSYRAQVRVANTRRTKTFKLKAAALAWVSETERLLLAEVVYGKRHTVLEAFEKYAEEVSIKKRGRRWEQIRLQAFAHIMPFATKTLDAVTTEDVAFWRDNRRAAPGTVIREMTLLGSVFNIAQREWGWVQDNVVYAVKKPPAPPARKVIYSDAQVEALCAYLTGPKSQEVALAFRLSLETAMRAGEILKLHWQDIDLEKGVARLYLTKNGDAREVPLSKKAVALLRPFRLEAGSLFTLSSQSLCTLFRKAKRRAGLAQLTFHDARATALTRMSRKVDVLTLARIAGHRDVKSLMVYYRESAESIASRL